MHFKSTKIGLKLQRVNIYVIKCKSHDCFSIPRPLLLSSVNSSLNYISGCYNLSLVHTVIYNYMQLLNQQIARKQEQAEEGGYQMDFKSRAEKSRSDLIVALREACVHILHSHDGSRLAMNCLW